MIKKARKDKLVTEEYLDRKLDEKLDEKLSFYATKKDLDIRTEEIIEVINEGFTAQGQIMTRILGEIADIKRDSRKTQIRLDDHDVRIETLEKAVN